MKIDKSKTYTINLTEEKDKIREEHKVLVDSTLTFSGLDLLRAIMHSGILPSYLYSRNRIDELRFKIALVQSALEEKKEIKIDKVTGVKEIINWLVLSKNTFDFLDPSEKGFIRYWIGMFFTTLLAMKKYGYKYVVHYYKFINSVLYKTPTEFISITGSSISEDSESTPDLIALTKKLDEYGVFEAKGRGQYKIGTMQNAYDQVKRVEKINGIKVKENIASCVLLSEKDLKIRFRDPEGDEEIVFDKYLAILWQYESIYELLKEGNAEEQDGYRVLKIKNELNESDYEIKMNSNVYDVFNKVFSMQDKVEYEEIKRVIDSAVDNNDELFVEVI